MHRRILHLDVDAFLASVEIARDPSLIGRPVVIGAGPEDTKTRNIVMSSSYAARAFGVRPGIHLAEARRLCPHAVFRKGDAQAANAARAALTRLLLDFTPNVAVTSIDDFLMDLTDAARLYPHPRNTAVEIARRVHAELGLPLSIGIGENPLLARLAGKLAKPGKVAELLPGHAGPWLCNLPVNALPGVGHSIGRRLAEFAIRTVGDLQLVSRELLFASFGRPGLVLFERARGIDESPVEATHWFDDAGELVARPPKSIRRESTFEPEEARFELVEAMLAYLVERATTKLRHHGLIARSVAVSLRYVDTRGARKADEATNKTHTKTRRLAAPSDATQDIVLHAKALLAELPRRRALVKRVGVALSNFTQAAGYQTHLFDALADVPLDARKDRHRALDRVIDQVRDRVGFGRILRGQSLPLLETHELDDDGFELRTPSLNQ